MSLVFSRALAGRASIATDRRIRGRIERASALARSRRATKRSVVSRESSGADDLARAPALVDDAAASASERKRSTMVGSNLPTPTPLARPPLSAMGGLASAGALESSYLAFQKLTGGEAACPLSGCQTALNSGYAELFGIPLSAYGAVAYGMVAALAFGAAKTQTELVEQGDENRDAELESKYGKSRVLLFFASTGLAAVSSYLLYVLAFKLGGAECLYCLTSAAISFTLFGIGFAGLSGKESANAAPPAVALYIITVALMGLVLTESPDASSTAGLRLAYAPPQLEQKSTAYSRSLAKHLAETGAKMYGAFWCSHCIEQKETFGAGAEIPYVECFPNGWERGTPVADACSAANVEGFPTWVIDGKKLEGEQTLEKLAELSGFRGENDAASMIADLF